MSEQEVMSIVQDIIRDNFDDDTIDVTPETTAHDVEDWDSLEQINLLTTMEQRFHIKFTLADVRDLANVGDMVALICRLIG